MAAAPPRMVGDTSTLADLTEFICNPRAHGPLTADATTPAWNGYLLTVRCPCGVVFERGVTPQDADRDLVSWARLKAGRN